MKPTYPPLRAAVVASIAVFALAACGSSATRSIWTFAPLPTGTPAPSASPGSSPSLAPSISPSIAPSASPSGEPSPDPSASGGPSPSASAGQGEVIELGLTAALQISDPDGEPVTQLDVTQGQTYTFRVTNEAGFAHNFFIGPAGDLAADQTDGLPGIPIFDTGTQEFEYTVTDETGSLEFACTIEGHYGPMHGTFVVEP